MQDLTRFALAANLKWLLLAGLAVLILLLVHGSWRSTVLNLERLRHWTRYPAQIVSAADAAELELEVGETLAASIPGARYPEYPTPDEPGNRRILVPRATDVPFASNGAAVLVQNPAAPAEIALLSPVGMWLPVLVKLLVALATAGMAYWLARQGWGQDLSWAQGGWLPTEQFGSAAGAGADPDQALSETRGSRIMPLFWTALFGGLLASGLVGAPWGRIPFYAPLIALALAVPCALAAVTAVESWTRRVATDDAGISDTTFFGAKRVPWSAIAGVRRENIAEASQQSHDRSRKRSGTRPQSIWVNHLVDTDGRPILGFGEELVPQDRFDALLARARGDAARLATRDTGRPAQEQPWSRAAETDEMDEDEAPAADALEAESARMRAEFGKHDRTMRNRWLLLVSPFLLLTLWLGLNAASYRFLSARAEGTVIAVEDDELRSLSVEYRDGAGNTHRIDSDGSRANLRYSTGDTLRVFYRADDPGQARLDLFLELWIGTMISAAITALVSIPLLLMR